MSEIASGCWYYCHVHHTDSQGFSPYMTFQVLYHQGGNQWSHDVRGLLPVDAHVVPQYQVEKKA